MSDDGDKPKRPRTPDGADIPTRADVVDIMTRRPPSEDQGTPGQEPIRRASRITQAVSLRVAGMTYAQIAEAAGYSSPSAVQQALYRASERLEREAIDDFRELENLRLDRLQTAVWTRAIEGDNAAIQTVLRISERRAKLNGLDKPLEVRITPASGDVLAWVQEALGVMNAEQQAITSVVEATIVGEAWEVEEEPSGDDPTDG